MAEKGHRNCADELPGTRNLFFEPVDFAANRQGVEQQSLDLEVIGS